MPHQQPQPDKTASQGLTAWWEGAARRALPGQIVRRQALITRFFKIVLPTAAIITLAVTLLWPAFLPSLPVNEWTKNISSELAMFDLTYRGTDDKGKPFTVSADKATRNLPLGMTPKEGETPLIDLEAPQAALQLDDGEAQIKANTGTYNETSKGLMLDGEVEMTRTDGLTVKSPDLEVDFEANRAWTDKPVTATGNFGEISGQGLRLEDAGKTIIFTGQTKAQLNSSRASEPTIAEPKTTDETPIKAPVAPPAVPDIKTPDITAPVAQP